MHKRELLKWFLLMLNKASHGFHVCFQTSNFTRYVHYTPFIKKRFFDFNGYKKKQKKNKI